MDGKEYPAAADRLLTLARGGEPDSIDPSEYVSAFTSGGCALYAAALVSSHRDWQVVAWGERTCASCEAESHAQYPTEDGATLCEMAVHHFYATDAEGWLYDIAGHHDPEAIAESDPHRCLRLVDDTLLVAVIDSWHLGDAEDATLAALAVELVGEDPEGDGWV